MEQKYLELLKILENDSYNKYVYNLFRATLNNKFNLNMRCVAIDLQVFQTMQNSHTQPLVIIMVNLAMRLINLCC